MNKVLITGASSGIGKELAHRFAKDQHHLIITARSEKELLALKEELEKKYSITVDLFPTDLSQIENVQKLTRWVAENGWSVTHLINNAGFGDVGLFEYTQWTKNQKMIELNITTLTALCHHYVPLMKENGFGRILNVASTAAFQPGPTMAVYFATKSYVLHFSEALNGELKGSGISVTALCPGPTQTQFAKAAGFNDNGIFDSTKKFPSAKEVAEFGYQSLLKQKSVAIHGLKNYVLANTSRIFPRDMVVAVAKWMMKG